MDHHGHHEPAPGQASENLVLDIGADTGALVIHTGPDRDQGEIEISPAGAGQPRTHNVVRARHVRAGIRHAAVFPALRAGQYTVWGDANTPAGTVTIQGGMTAEFHLPGAPVRAPRADAISAAPM